MLKNARELTTDSKRMIRLLREGHADVIVNWRATASWPENQAMVTALPIDEKYAKKKRLMLGMLKSSKHPEVARKFMSYAISDQGRAVFRRYGFLHTE